MTDSRVRSWIFLAISAASQIEPSSFEKISMIADGINHAVPTHKEIQSTISYLVEKKLVGKVANKYVVTARGKTLLSEEELGSKGYTESWEKLEQLFENL